LSDQQSPFVFAHDSERYLATLAKIYEQDGQRKLQSILVNSQVRIDEGISKGGWQDEAWGHALHLVLPQHLFIFGLKETLSIQNKIREDLNKIISISEEFISEVSLGVAVEESGDWRKDSGLLVTAARSVPSDANTRIWGNEGYFRLFLSHLSKFKADAAKLKDDLRLFGVSCFVAHKDIEPLKEWQDEIELALASTDALAALLTPGFNESLWTDQEVGFTYARRVPIIPVRLGIDPHGFMSRFQALSTDWKNCPLGIAKLLINDPKMFSAFVRALRVIPNWNTGNLVGEVLPAIQQLSAPQVDEIITAYNETLELRGCFEFNGTNPRYGKGLVFHLNRLSTSRQFWFDKSGLIAEV
jgi:hypothetical protein